MLRKSLLRTFVCCLALFCSTEAKLQIVTTIAGNGTIGYSGDGGLAIYAMVGASYDVEVDKEGNVYFVDEYNAVIRKIDAVTGIISTIAGTGTQGYSGDGGLAVNAQINSWVGGLAIDSLGNIYFSDGNNNRIRKIDKSTGIITTIAGTGEWGYYGDGGLATAAKLKNAAGIALDASGSNLYITGFFDCRVRKIDLSTGIITTAAGNGYLGYNGDEIPATQAQVGYVFDINIDKQGNLYITDYSNHRIRKVTISDGKIHTIAGNGTAGYSGDGGPATLAQVDPDSGIKVDSADNILFVDSRSRIRKVDQKNNIITTIAGTGDAWYSGDGLLATDAAIGPVRGISTDVKGNIYFTVTDNLQARICKITVDSFLLNQIHGYAYYDFNRNNQIDINENFFTNGKIVIKKNIDSTITMLTHGNFRIGMDTGNFSAYFLPSNDYYLPVPATHSFSFTDYGQEDSVFFALQPVAGKRDLFVNMYSLHGASVPGFGGEYRIQYQNRGTDTISSGYVQLVKDHRFNFTSSTPANDYINGDTIRWNYSNLEPLDTASIFIQFYLPPANASIGDTLHSFANISPVAGDLTPQDDSAFVVQPVRSSFDPNDKTENHGGAITQRKVSNGEWLVYTIRFQNTGNAPAVNIAIKDTLDTQLDWNSLQMITSSHASQLNITNGKNCVWTFSNIMLPDSTANEPASHGYIVYRIKAKNNLKIGDIISNTASIYFDYNAPVQTNTEKTKVIGETLLPLQIISFNAIGTGNSNLLSWSTAQEINVDRFEIQRSNNSRNFAGIGNVKAFNNGKTKNDYSFTDVSPLKQTNYYRLKIIDRDGKFVYSAVKAVNNLTLAVTVYPNPVKDMLKITGLASVDKASVSIVDMCGVMVVKTTIASNASISVQHLKAGVYELRIEAEGKAQSIKFLKE